jgi:methylglutaconyl-CoA hydratase
MTTESNSVLYFVRSAVAWITLNRPEKRNALNAELVSELKQSLRTAAATEAVRAVVLTGAGSDFCSGADLAALEKIREASVSENVTDAHSLLELFMLIREVPLPVIAAVRGRALAGGCGLANACDITLASRTARFGYPEVRIGFVPAIVTAMLRRNLSEKQAFEFLARGIDVSAEEAWRLGLVNQVYDDATFENDVADYVHKFEKTSKSALALTKSLLYEIDGMTFPDALAAGADVNVIARMTEDCRKGIERFLKKD